MRRNLHNDNNIECNTIEMKTGRFLTVRIEFWEFLEKKGFKLTTSTLK